MPVSDVQLDTGIGVGRAQVLKPLDVQGLYDAQTRKKQLEEQAKARKAKELEDKKDAVRRQLMTPHDMIERDRTKYDQMRDEAFALAEKDPNSPDLAKKVFELAEFGKSAQDFKKQWIAKITDVNKKGDEMLFGMDELEKSVLATSDPNDPNYDIKTDPSNASFDRYADLDKRYKALSGVKLVKREKDAVDAIQRQADTLGDELVSTMDSALTQTERMNTSEAFKTKKEQTWNALRNSYKVKNLIDQKLYDDPNTTAEQAEAEAKAIFDNAVDTRYKQTLDKTKEKQKFSFGAGGSAENNIYRVLPGTEVDAKGNLKEISIQSITGGEPKVIIAKVNKLVPATKDTPEHFVTEEVKGSASRWERIGGSYRPFMKVPVLDKKGKPTGAIEEYPVDASDYTRFNNEVGISPYDIEQNLGGHKVVVRGTNKAPVKKSESKKQASSQDQESWNAAWSKLKPGFSMVGLDGKTYTKK